jgi:NAD-dependent deacetylase
VLFGELLPDRKVMQLQRELSFGFDIIFSIGTSSLFPYIVEPVVNAKFMGTPTVEINPANTDLSRMVDHKIALGAAEALQGLWESLE